MDTGALLIGAVSIVAAYLVGAIPWGVVIARVVGGPDPRTLGSGRTGGANVLRVLGPRVAAAAAVLDLLKGCVAVGIPLALAAFACGDLCHGATGGDACQAAIDQIAAAPGILIVDLA